MPEFNVLNLAAIDQAAQKTNANKFAMERAQVGAQREDTQYTEDQQLEDYRLLAGGTKVLMDIYQKDPNEFLVAADEIRDWYVEQGILDGSKVDTTTPPTIEAITDLHNKSMAQLGGRPINENDPNKSSRIQNYEFYAGLNDEERSNFQNANAASKGMKTVKVPQSDGTDLMVNYDPQTGEGYNLQTGETLIVRPGAGGEQLVYGQSGLIGPATQSAPGFGKSQRPQDEAANKKRAELAVQKEADAELEVDSALTGLNKALRLKPVITRARDKASWTNTGFMSVFNFIPGLTGKNLEADLQTIKANLGFGELAEMRRTSKTGGAVGQLSDRELTVLSSMLRNLDTSQTYEQLHTNLADVLVQYERWADAYSKDIAEKGTEDQFSEYYMSLPDGSTYYQHGTGVRKVKVAR